MRLLITGGTGFIGSRTALWAKALGHEVRVTGMRNTPAETANHDELRSAGIEVLLTGLEALAEPDGPLRGVDAVIHLAAAQHEMNVPDDYFFSVNVDGTAALLEASRQAGVGRFVYGSTIGVYGRRQGRLDETTPPAPDNIYGRTKLKAEELVLSRKGELPVVAVRISETYGPGDRRLLKLFRAIRKGTFLNVGDGRNLHHPIFVDDLAQGLLLAAEHPRAPGEVFVLPGRDIVTTDEMVAAIAAAVGRAMPKVRLPAWPFMVAALVLETSLRPLGIQPPLHRRRMDFFLKSFNFDGSKAQRVLGFEPRVGFREGAARTARWYEAIGEL
ncbi:NAD-dependent epimerase/dehydratase family protein [Benzoatithermus flavus]|uniref:NAD-dependent epimerase/dehydratase family protein n=1 Tax=Benzoatithermus flavus TaxID=3108223 RepID=A0ABU8XV20_9PROT